MPAPVRRSLQRIEMYGAADLAGAVCRVAQPQFGAGGLDPEVLTQLVDHRVGLVGAGPAPAASGHPSKITKDAGYCEHESGRWID